MNRFTLALMICTFVLTFPSAFATSLPANVIAYIPANIYNSQATAIPSNTQLILPFNALNYTTYLNANLLNVVLFNGISGAQAPLFLEGNSMNWVQVGSLSTSSSIIYVAKIPDSIPATTADDNWYFGLASTTSNVLSSSGYSGEASYLSCNAYPTCGSGYGLQDNGANVFTTYNTFGSLSSTSLAAMGWSEGTTSSNTFTPTNILVTPVGANVVVGIYATSPYSANTPGNSLDALMVALAGSGASSGTTVGVFDAKASESTGAGAGNCEFGIGGQEVPSYPNLRSCIGGAGFSIAGIQTAVIPAMYSYSLVNTIAANFMYNYFQSKAETNTTNNKVGTYLNFGTTNAMPASLFYIDTRQSPNANGIQPKVGLGAALTGCTFTISNSIFNFGSVFIGQNLPTQNAIFIDNTGSVTSNILLDGGPWKGSNPPDNFLVTNTIWDWSYGTPYGTANYLQAAQTDTDVPLAGGTGINLFLGINIPNTAVADSYTQTVNVINSC